MYAFYKYYLTCITNDYKLNHKIIIRIIITSDEPHVATV